MTNAEREAIDALLIFTAVKPGFHPVVDFDAMERLYVAARKLRHERERERGTEHASESPRSGF